LKIFPEKQYREILDEVGSYRYAIYEQDELIPGNLFTKTLGIENYHCVVAGTGDTLSICTLILSNAKEIIIPQGSPVVVVRLLREDLSHGEPHYNADDQIIFPTVGGDIFRLPRKDAPDHFFKIAGTANMLTIADAYHLPEEKSGPITQYSEKGARLHIDLFPVQGKNDFDADGHQRRA